MIRNSLSFRIVAYSGLLVVFTLAATALLIALFYRTHIQQHFDQHVRAHLDELAMASSMTADGAFALATSPSDPHLGKALSGWYWEVKQSGTTLARSESLGSHSLTLIGKQPTSQVAVRAALGPGGQKLRAQAVNIELTPGQASLTYISTAPEKEIAEDIANFDRHITGSFLLLGLGLLAAVVTQVRIALRPLKRISAEISDIRSGKAKKLQSDFPTDIQPLVTELNNLIEHNAFLLSRARDQLGDLAHAVKTPLTVIMNEANLLDGERKNLTLKQAHDISKSINHYLSRARAFGHENVLGSRSEVVPIIQDLVFAMQRIYQSRELDFELSGLTDCWFRGESQDLEEMVGNLLDNACKWANKRVRITCACADQKLQLVVEDDGPGIPEHDIPQALQRGFRLDESTAGHGLGLGIVRNLAQLYRGSLTIGKSSLGGVSAILELPGT